METLIVERDAGVVTVTINRPEKRNAMTTAMFRELRETFADISRRADDRVMILTGAAGAFSAGADLTQAPEHHPLVHMRSVSDMALELHRLAKPTIAKVNGAAIGAACNLALGCDLIVASDDARFGETFSQRGLSVDCGGSWLLPRLIGLHRAKELVLLGDIISAKEAWEIGLVNRVVPGADLDRFVSDWAGRLAAGPPLAQSMSKTLLNHSWQTSMDQALEDEARCQAVNLETADMAEAMRAFFEKRQPQFQGS